MTTAVEFSLNYRQHKVGISGNHFFPFVSFVKFTIVKISFVKNAA